MTTQLQQVIESVKRKNKKARANISLRKAFHWRHLLGVRPKEQPKPDTSHVDPDPMVKLRQQDKEYWGNKMKKHEFKPK